MVLVGAVYVSTELLAMAKNSDKKVLNAFLLALLVVIGIVLASILHTLNAHENNQRYAESVDRLLLLNRLEARLLEAETSERGYFLTGDNIFKEEFDLLSNDVSSYLQELRRLDFSAVTTTENIQHLESLIRQRLQSLGNFIDVYETEGFEAARTMVQNRTGKALMDKYQNLNATIETAELAFLLEQRKSALQSATRLMYLLSAGTLLNLLLLGMAFVIGRKDLRLGQSLLGQMQRSSNEISYLNEMSNSLLSCQQLTDADQIIQHYMQLLFPTTSGGFYLHRASRNVLELHSTWGTQQSELSNMLLIEECWALRRGRTHIVDKAEDLHCEHDHADTDTYYFCIPMMAQGETIGILHMRCNPEPQAGKPCDLKEFFSDNNIQLAETVAIQIASAIASLNLRAALHAKSIKDPLTGLYNRRYLEATMQREQVRAQRNNTPFSIIMTDIDHFKAFNDSHGHQAGDSVLQLFGQELNSRVRGEDIACRYGGEEFTLILPGADLEKAGKRAEEIRIAVSQLRINVRGQSLPPITASFGVASFPLHGDDWQTVMQVADGELYQAKQAGRNNVSCAQNPKPAARKPDE